MRRWTATLLSVLAVACLSDIDRKNGGTGTSKGDATKAPTHGNVVMGPVTGQPCALEVRVRDFKTAHPDFEGLVNQRVVPGLVETTLGPDRKPRSVASVAGPAGISAFDDWYNDRPGVNEAAIISLTLEETQRGVFVFDSDSFFPLDDQALGDEGRAHNYLFTSEIHTRFRYDGGERFTFAGDDDLWMFINGKLAIDLGGVHPRATSVIDLDARREEFGITPGAVYDMDIFHAERHTIESTFRIETTIDCFMTVI